MSLDQLKNNFHLHFATPFYYRNWHYESYSAKLEYLDEYNENSKK